MKKFISTVLASALLITSAAVFTGCFGSAKSVEISIPNDTTNEARALLLLDDLGYIKLDPSAGITATPADITENPKNISFKG